MDNMKHTIIIIKIIY